MKRYCLTFEYPGICWTYDSENPRIFFECDENYKMIKNQIKGVVKLTFKRWINKEDIRYVTF